MVEDETVVETAAQAAHGYVFSQLSQSDVDDLDVTVTFEDGTLTVEVYVLAPDVDADVDQVADDAALVARNAVDELFADSGDQED
ncbi:MAG: DUF3194 domain-containing protein [Halanaeroarchaeum sp.]